MKQSLNSKLRVVRVVAFGKTTPQSPSPQPIRNLKSHVGVKELRGPEGTPASVQLLAKRSAGKRVLECASAHQGQCEEQALRGNDHVPGSHAVKV